MTPKEMLEKRGKLAAEIRKLADLANDENRDFSGEEKKQWEQVNHDYDELTRNYERAQRAEAVAKAAEAPVGDPRVGRDNRDGRDALVPANDPPGDERRLERTEQPTEEHRELALQAWCRAQLGEDVTEPQAEACRLVGLNPNRRQLELGLPEHGRFRRMQAAFRDGPRSGAEQRALSVVTGSAGGVLVPEGFVNNLEVNMLAFGGMLQVAEILRTTTGNELPWPTADDTSNTGEQVGESTDVGEADPSFGQIIFRAFKYSSKLVKVPIELLEDSAFNLAAEIGRMLGERLGRITNTRMTTGTGAGQPNGITLASTLGVTAASATAIAFDELFDLVHSIDAAYRTGPGVRWMFHDNVLLYLRKIKDGEGRYIWQGGTTTGQPDTLLNYPYTINSDMASSIASSAITMLFGDLSKYKIRQVRTVRLRRLVERYAETDQEGFVAFIRQDGNLLDAGTHPVKYLQQA